MKLRLEDKQKAISLRLQGKTYNEIRDSILNLSKSTISGWLKDLTFTAEQKRNLKKHVNEVKNSAREKSILTRIKKRQQRIKNIINESKKEYIYLSKKPFFLICLALYWAEGNKKSGQFQFTNSDPYAIKIIMEWLIRTCKIPKSEIKIRLYTHQIFMNENYEKFWAKITGVPIANFQKTVFKGTPHKVKKNINYKGCIQLRVLKTDFQCKVITWVQELINEFAK